MGIYLVQNDFTHGELSPLLLTRNDLALYTKSAQKLRNVVVLPQGGAKRRWGTQFIASMPVETAGTDGYQICEFQFDETTFYLLVFFHQTLRIYKNDTLVEEMGTPFDTAIIRQLQMAQTANRLIIIHPTFQPYILYRGANDTTWTLEHFNITYFPPYVFNNNYSGATFTLSQADIGSATLTADQSVFTTAHVNGTFIGPGPSVEDPIGYGRITAFSSATEVSINILAPFGNTVVPGSRAILGEPAWSDTRGWPRSVCFYENRLVFGGTPSLGETVFLSRIGDFANFGTGLGEADEAIIVTLAANSYSPIKYLLSGRTLEIFTDNAEFSTPQPEWESLTPGNIAIRRQTNNGISDVAPLLLDNRTFYVKKGGGTVMAFAFEENARALQSQNISLLSEQLIRNPIDSAVLHGASKDGGDWLFLVNEDGTLAIYQTLQEQNISAWTLGETEGKFIAVTDVNTDLYVLVEREVNGSMQVYLEKFSFEIFVDSSKEYALENPSQTLSGLDHLEGETVQIRGDGYVFPSQTVINAQVFLPTAVSNASVGIGFTPLIKTMPVNVVSQEGNMSYRLKNINRYWVDYYQSLGVYVNNELVPYRAFEQPVLDAPPEVQTGIFEGGTFGWDRRISIEITQQQPLPMTILGVGYEVST